MKYLYLNGTKILLDNDINLLTFLETQNLFKKQIAIAINGSVIQKKEYKKTIIREGDKIEVVHAVGGGK
jgi:thiamine biosynthesis protein ThiS